MLCLQDIDCRDFTGKIFKRLGLGVERLQVVDCRFVTGIILKGLGLELFLVWDGKLVGSGAGAGSQLSVLDFQFASFPLPVLPLFLL